MSEIEFPTFEFTDHSVPGYLTRKRVDYGNGYGASVIQDEGEDTWDFVVTKVVEGKHIDILHYTAEDEVDWETAEELVRAGYTFTNLFAGGLL